ncbi:MAG: hypothetical protein Q9168_001479 [Polycauliona sp. 1 TL-2023]
MGNDGGSIPTRRELVKEAAKDPNNTQVKETQTEKLQYYWSHCSLSQRPLAPPIVSDSTGNLYNKDAVLENLLNSNKDGQDGNVASNDRTAGTIKSLRDIVEVRFSIDEAGEEQSSKPKVDEVRLCNEPYTTDSVIPILPVSLADKDRLRDRLSKLHSEGLTHSLKKAQGSSKKRKQARPNTKESEATTTTPTTDSAGPNLPSKETVPETSSDAIRNEDTAALTAKVLAEQKDRNKRRKIAPNENLSGLFSSSNGMAGKQSDFMTRGFSIPNGAKR